MTTYGWSQMVVYTYLHTTDKSFLLNSSYKQLQHPIQMPIAWLHHLQKNFLLLAFSLFIWEIGIEGGDDDNL